MAGINLEAAGSIDLSQLLNDWVGIGLSTERADRPRAEAGVRQVYEATLLTVPRQFIWLDSPMAGFIGAASLAGTEEAGPTLWRPLWGDIGWRVDRTSRHAAGNQIGAAIGQMVRTLIGHEVTEHVSALVWNQVWRQISEAGTSWKLRHDLSSIWDAVSDAIGLRFAEHNWNVDLAEIRAEVWIQAWAHILADGVRWGPSLTSSGFDWNPGVLFGQHDAAFIGASVFSPPDESDEGEVEWMSGMSEVARSCGWWWPFRNLVILTERPTELHRDREGRLHNPDGPAIRYPDGWGLWAIEGMRVTEQLATGAQSLTFDQVRCETNVEVRRHMLDHFAGLRGAEAQAAWFAAGGLDPISTEDITDKMRPYALSCWRATHGDAPVTCRLYHAEFADDDPLAILIVVCTSTAKETPLRVPPSITNAAAARAWTFGRDLSEAFET